MTQASNPFEPTGRPSQEGIDAIASLLLELASQRQAKRKDAGDECEDRCQQRRQAGLL